VGEAPSWAKTVVVGALFAGVVAALAAAYYRQLYAAWRARQWKKWEKTQNIVEQTIDNPASLLQNLPTGERDALLQATHYCSVKREAEDNVPVRPLTKVPGSSTVTFFFRGDQWPKVADWCQENAP